MIAVLESGETGNLHYQGYLEFQTSRKLTCCKALLPSAHFEIRRGSRQQAIAYVMKTLDIGLMGPTQIATAMDAWFINPCVDVSLALVPKVVAYNINETYAELLNTNKRTVNDQLKEVQQAIIQGKSEEEIADDYFDLWIKYNQSFTKYKLLKAQPRSHKTKVIVIQGPTGTGKSKWALDNYPLAYWKPRSDWWDGYSTQETVVLDEFYGWLPFDLLLRLCDRYPLNVHIKGGSVNFVAKTLIITTNKHPELWYKSVYFKSFIRRVEEWRVYGEDGESIYSNYEDVKFINC